MESKSCLNIGRHFAPDGLRPRPLAVYTSLPLPPNPLLGGDLSQRTRNYDRKRQRTAHRMQPEKTYFSPFSESRSALAAALAALRSAFSCIFSGLRPKSEKCT